MKSLRTRLGAALLAAVLAVSVIVPAAAAPATFSDVPSNAWYAQDVADVQKYGIINGVGNNKFLPDGVLTYVQAITMAARVYAYQHRETIPEKRTADWFGAERDWATPYLLYAVDKEIIAFWDQGMNDAYHDAPCPRDFMADLFYSVVSLQDNVILNNINAIPDVVEDSDGYPIYCLYRYGILTGSNKYGTFYPERSITRAETAAILNRVLNPDKRKAFSLVPGSLFMSLDHSIAWTNQVEDTENGFTTYYNTTIAFMEDGSMYGMYYIPESGYSERFRGTYKTDGNAIVMTGKWDDGSPFNSKYEVAPIRGYMLGFTLSLVSREGFVYYHNPGEDILFWADDTMTANQCKDICLQYWGAEPQ